MRYRKKMSPALVEADLIEQLKKRIASDTLRANIKLIIDEFENPPLVMTPKQIASMENAARILERQRKKLFER